MSLIQLFSGTEPDVYSLSKIFDPDIHDPNAESSRGLVVPAVDSLVVDRTSSPGKLVLWIVKSVDPVTFKSTLELQHDVHEVDAGPDRLVSYGNDTLMLHFDDRSDPTRLIVDGKVVLVGNYSAEYRLVKIVGDEEVIISFEIDNDGNIVSDRIPIVDTAVSGIRRFADAHTSYNIEDGDFIRLEIYDTTGVLTTEVRLIAKRSATLNDYLSSSNPLVAFDATANQLNGSEWVLYKGQNPEDLTVWPEATYADGTKELVPINSVNCFIYGVDEIDTDTPGVYYNVIIKYFLADDVPSAIAQGENNRFVITEEKIKIVNRQLFSYSKIQPVPKYNSVASRWDLVFFAYDEDRDGFRILEPTAVEYVGATFDGTAIGQQQNLVIRSIVDDGNGYEIAHVEEFTIQVNDPTSATPFLIAPDENSELIYGENTGTHHRPLVNYDASRGTYFIPTSDFADTTEYLDNFYYRSNPPRNPLTEQEPPVPTHFVMRDSTNGRILVSEPIAIGTYDQEFVLLSNTGNANQYNNKTIMVEFLQEISGTFTILVGVPVEVRDGVFNT